MPLLLALALVALVAFAPAAWGQQALCEGGVATHAGTAYPCRNVDLLARLPHGTFASPESPAPPPTSGGAMGNEVWGWTDAETGREYALVGLTNGTAFVDVTEPTAPVYLGKLPTATVASLWRTLRVYRDHVFVGSEASGHGVQVLDLRRLRGLTGSPVVTFQADARYTGAGRAHTLFVNEGTGFLYLAGANERGYGCNGGGLHIVDVRDPLRPAFAGCYDANGYTHETHCEVYPGPDTRYAGREVCTQYQGTTGAGGAGNHVAFVDVTDKAAPERISQAFYPNPGYTHQGWFSEDRRFLFVNDELDELLGVAPPARTIILDVRNLERPEFFGHYTAPVPTIDHNLYVKGRYLYQSNYESGLRIVDVAGVASGGGSLREVAFFDTHPQSSSALSFNGQWHHYPFFASGTILANDMQNGLFVLRFNDPLATGGEPGQDPEAEATLSPAEPNPFRSQTRLALTVRTAQHVRAEAFDARGRRVAVLYDGAVADNARLDLVLDGSALPAGAYVVRVTGERFGLSERVVLAR